MGNIQGGSMMTEHTNRRAVLQFAAIGVVGCAAAAEIRKSMAASPAKVPFELGMASYTFRQFPLDQTLEMTKRLGLKRICLKDFHLKMDATPAQIADTVAKVKAAGL